MRIPKLSEFNRDIHLAAEYHARMAVNLLQDLSISSKNIHCIVRAAFALGAKYQKNITENKHNIIE